MATAGVEEAEAPETTKRGGVIADLISCGYVTRTSHGSRTRYAINPDGRLRHPLQADHTIGELLTAIGRLRPPKTKKPAQITCNT